MDLLESAKEEPSKYESAVSKSPSPSDSTLSDPTLNDDDESLKSEVAVLPTKSRIRTQLNSIINPDLDPDHQAQDVPIDPDSSLLDYARTNKIEELKVLLQAKLDDGLNLNLNFKGQEKRNSSWTALHLACYFGHLEIVQLLFSHNKFCQEINVNIQNNSGDTALHKAALSNRVQIVQLLLSHGANVFIQNCDALLARQLTHNKEILKMLEAAEQVDRNQIKLDLFNLVDNGDVKALREYIRNYSSCQELGSIISADEQHNRGSQSTDEEETRNLKDGQDHARKTDEPLNMMTDDRGNTLLHLASMRGFKAICVYLLEQGLDPYKQNNLGQTCFDLSSYNLRQLFTRAKPTTERLKILSKQRASRFEGPLLKKVRILGWRETYVVLDNGAILLFNNKRDSKNKSCRGYKYLDSATCDIDQNEIAIFTISFSDRSKAIFAVSPEHLKYYNAFNRINSSCSARPQSSVRSDHHHHHQASTKNQIELVRQKWIDSIADHIQYSLKFINEQADDDCESDLSSTGVANLNHLLPVDTMNSFVQEARAHYSILERHAEFLWNLVQQISSNYDKSDQSSLDIIDSDADRLVSDRIRSSQAPASKTSRLLTLLKSTSRNPNISPVSLTARRPQQQQQQGPSSAITGNRKASLISNSTSLTKSFLDDDWHCIVFHLRLLLESAQNTKQSMGQAISLIERQEQIRQSRMQDLEERCKILENTIHHELERSVSGSHFNLHAAQSISTDLNDYHDAFEDFDEDQKTMTPGSLPDNDGLEEQMRDFAEDEEDLQSNCSALTIESISDSLMNHLGGNRMVDEGHSSSNKKYRFINQDP